LDGQLDGQLSSGTLLDRNLEIDLLRLATTLRRSAPRANPTRPLACHCGRPNSQLIADSPNIVSGLLVSTILQVAAIFGRALRHSVLGFITLGVPFASLVGMELFLMAVLRTAEQRTVQYPRLDAE
jgi:hypothetical protein